MPELHRAVGQRTRRALLLKYPYVVYYASSPAEMIVTAIFHSSRDPRRWADRVHENAGSMVAIYSADCPA
jgi:plasmid stabilization system protein ParE